MPKRFKLLNKRLFIQKLTALVVATLVLVPLVHFKLEVPALLYVGSLLVLHIVFLYLYFARTPWRQLLANKPEFGLRLIAVGFFIYILSLIKFEGSSGTIIMRLLIAMVVHGFILTGMMVIRTAETTDNRPKKTP
jgi:hypothetical protein